ncbi:FAD-dependent thymidylate synthase [Streptomyces reniochalinae]|uniref:Flavin-dependent thymidylate synthase n=1 Tax=Streptomyces reniochalinae TaxID=2250578 RepID=A0A367EFY4_9ACTN|nr:FAD-dependent thymidylate synthase [Streptomyces reniochalinae]RCG16961.1 FAD-dependent thymidylate synthase [Streptomyces reniochalinae]
MKVDVLARTILDWPLMEDAYGYDAYGQGAKSADALAEAAGRICYKSFHRPNPKTAANADYLANILRQGHYSVLEHSSVSFLVRGVSRALLAELTRHRHLSFSVVSQRYVNYAETEPVIPPALADKPNATRAVEGAYEDALAMYEVLTERLTAAGLKRKEAREAARCVLPNAAPVDMVVTGNLRAWRDVLGKRHHVAADKEIREFAGLILGHLRAVAPNSVQDVPEAPYGSEGE